MKKIIKNALVKVYTYFARCPYCGYVGRGWPDSGECPRCGETS